MKTSDVCIVGGGPAGLAAALALARSGREVTVLDCATPPIDKACGEGLMPDSLEALRQLDVALPADAGYSFRGIKFIGGQSSVAADFPSGLARGVRRQVLHRLLIQHAERAGVRMVWGVKNVRAGKGAVAYAGAHIRTGLVVGADGQQSRVRHDAGLNQVISETRRFGFRKHYQTAPWSAYVEVYWGAGFQIYVTPVDAEAVCVALISSDAHLRLDAALAAVPVLNARLRGASPLSPEKGCVTASRRLRRVYTDGVILLGDASGSADAITGEGICLAFKQSAALVEALDAGDLRIYAARHRALAKRPMRMASMLMMLNENKLLQRKALAALSAHQPIFSSLLAAHVGQASLAELCSWRLLSFGFGFLAA